MNYVARRDRGGGCDGQWWGDGQACLPASQHCLPASLPSLLTFSDSSALYMPAWERYRQWSPSLGGLACRLPLWPALPASLSHSPACLFRRAVRRGMASGGGGVRAWKENVFSGKNERAGAARKTQAIVTTLRCAIAIFARAVFSRSLVNLGALKWRQSSISVRRGDSREIRRRNRICLQAYICNLLVCWRRHL